jgi:hypothetical protein
MNNTILFFFFFFNMQNINIKKAFALISAGEAKRHVGSTDANAASSRSHTIFRLTVESRKKGEGIDAAVRDCTYVVIYIYIYILKVILESLYCNEATYASFCLQKKKKKKRIRKLTLFPTCINIIVKGSCVYLATG